MSLDRYMNTPINWDLETEIRKATYTVMNFCEEGVLQESGGKSPEEMLSGASGLAFITVMKAVRTGQKSPTHPITPSHHGPTMHNGTTTNNRVFSFRAGLAAVSWSAVPKTVAGRPPVPSCVLARVGAFRSGRKSLI